MTARQLCPAVAMLEGLYQHRLLSTRQLHDLYTPMSISRWTQELTWRLQRVGLVAAVRRPGGLKIFYLTPAGIDAVEAAPRTEPRRKLVVPEQAQGPLQRDTLAVNDVGIAFVRAARSRGDEFGPLAWRHEIAHPLGPPPGRKRPEELIADALLSYQQQQAGGGTRFQYRFLELDRNTMPVDALAAKLARYARLHRHTIQSRTGRSLVLFWATRYPVFPTVLLVLDNGSVRSLRRRAHTVLALCAEDPELQQTPAVELSVCLLQDLTATGPFSPIWTTPENPETPVDWLGTPATPAAAARES